MNKSRTLSKYIVKSGQITSEIFSFFQQKQLKTHSNQNKRIICRRCLPCRLYRIIRQDSLQFYLLFIYQQAICARRNLQFNSCASQSLKSWGLGLLYALRHRVLGCSIDYCSHVKATSYSIVIKTKHWQTKFVSSHQRILC